MVDKDAKYCSKCGKAVPEQPQVTIPGGTEHEWIIGMIRKMRSGFKIAGLDDGTLDDMEWLHSMASRGVPEQPHQEPIPGNTVDMEWVRSVLSAAGYQVKKVNGNNELSLCIGPSGRKITICIVSSDAFSFIGFTISWGKKPRAAPAGATRVLSVLNKLNKNAWTGTYSMDDDGDVRKFFSFPIPDHILASDIVRVVTYFDAEINVTWKGAVFSVLSQWLE